MATLISTRNHNGRPHSIHEGNDSKQQADVDYVEPDVDGADADDKVDHKEFPDEIDADVDEDKTHQQSLTENVPGMKFDKVCKVFISLDFVSLEILQRVIGLESRRSPRLAVRVRVRSIYFVNDIDIGETNTETFMCRSVSATNAYIELHIIRK